MDFFANISLPFADLTACASWSGGALGRCPFQLFRAVFEPSLPPGMSVDYATALIGEISSSAPIHGFRFALRFASQVENGSPESGECLDAQSFAFGESLATVGTEDGDALTARLRWFNLDSSKYPIGYLVDGLELAIDYLPPNAIFDFHFVVAYNAVCRNDCSEWYAVDIPHSKLQALELMPVLGMPK